MSDATLTQFDENMGLALQAFADMAQTKDATARSAARETTELMLGSMRGLYATALAENERLRALIREVAVPMPVGGLMAPGEIEIYDGTWECEYCGARREEGDGQHYVAHKSACWVRRAQDAVLTDDDRARLAAIWNVRDDDDR